MADPKLVERGPLELDEIVEIVGEDAAENLEDELDALLREAPVFEWSGDLRIEGDVTSNELFAQLAGFEAPEGATAYDRSFGVLVRGNLEVSGVLSVAQYHDVFVVGDVQARSISSHTGNLVVSGRITADEVIAFECNEEGGLLHGASCGVPLLCRFSGDGGGPQWAVENEGPIEHWQRTPGFEELTAALAGLGVEASFSGLRELVCAGRAPELLAALGAS